LCLISQTHHSCHIYSKSSPIVRRSALKNLDTSAQIIRRHVACFARLTVLVNRKTFAPKMRRAGWPESQSSLHSLVKKLAASGIIREGNIGKLSLTSLVLLVGLG
jgi:hypothetical protein